jgi:hypothetical protein
VSGAWAVEPASGEQAPSDASIGDEGAYPATSQDRRDRCGLFESAPNSDDIRNAPQVLGRDAQAELIQRIGDGPAFVIKQRRA